MRSQHELRVNSSSSGGSAPTVAVATRSCVSFRRPSPRTKVQSHARTQCARCAASLVAEAETAPSWRAWHSRSLLVVATRAAAVKRRLPAHSRGPAPRVSPGPSRAFITALGTMHHPTHPRASPRTRRQGVVGDKPEEADGLQRITPASTRSSRWRCPGRSRLPPAGASPPPPAGRARSSRPNSAGRPSH